MIIDGGKAERAIEEEFDYVIVGSGAAGATAARVLADTGARLAVVEEGPAVSTPEFGDRIYPAFHHLLRNMGGIMARGRAYIPILQGRCLGGSTVVNSAIMWRLPDDVWEPWRSEFGLGDALPLDELHRHWDRIEQELHVRPVSPDVWGEHNRLMDVAGRRLGVSARPIRRADNGCRGSARCMTGCPYGAKQSMHVSYLPYASERGAALFTGARVERVLMAGDRAGGVCGRFQRSGPPRGIPFVLRARKAVVVAASALQTPGLLRRSGVRSPHLGRHFQGHPGTPLVGIFDRKVNMWFGATQGYDTDHHRRDLRFKIETISLPPELAFVRMPGVGRHWLASMAETPYAAIWAVQLRSYAEGLVREGWLGTDAVFDLTDRDMVNLRKGLRFTAEMFFAAGAREVILGIAGMPERIRSMDDAARLESGPASPAAYSFILTHLFSTARMSVRPQDGVVAPDFTVHGTRNLYVLDSSIFPTNLGVNPQHAIMGVAMHGAHRIAGQD